MNAKIVKKPNVMPVLMVATVLLGTAGLTMTTTAQSAFAYTNNQAQSLVNECGIDGSTGPNCANNGPQTIGDGVANALTPLQISNSGQRGTQGPTEPPTEPPATGTLKVIKVLRCPSEGITCPDPEEFGIEVTGNNPVPPSFQASSTGVDVKLEPGEYSVDETSFPDLPAGVIHTEAFSEECSGTINAGETITCTITNTVEAI